MYFTREMNGESTNPDPVENYGVTLRFPLIIKQILKSLDVLV